MTDYTNILPTDTRDAQLLLSDTFGGSGCTPYNRVLLVIDEDGEVELEARTYYGGDGTPMREWYGLDLTYTLAPGADASTLRDDLGDGGRVSTLIDAVRAGRSVEWDGHNHVGRLTEDAEEASDELAMLLDDYPTYDGRVATAELWLTGGQEALHHSVGPDDTAEALLAAAEADGWIITDGLAGMEACVEEAAQERGSAPFDVGELVEAGEGDEFDTGRIVAMLDPPAGDCDVEVAWDSGVRTPADSTELRRRD